MKERIYLYDSTLRDGGQTSTINFTVNDKRKIAIELDKLGIDYIEGGWPGANQTDTEFFSALPKLTNSKFTSFGMTSRHAIDPKNDKSLNKLISSNVSYVCIVGKSWDFHLKHALNITEEQNFEMISNSIAYIKANNKEAIFDAEHFFDGYKKNPDYALSCIKTAFDEGSRWIVLCDTNGGTLPNEVGDIVSEVNSGLVIIDQHVAHERILYEDALKAFESSSMASQTLLFPETLEFSPDDFDALFDVLPYLEKIGFKIKKQDNLSIKIDAIPSEMAIGNEREVIREILDNFLKERKKYSSFQEGIAAMFACKAAIKAGDSLMREEMQELVNRLFSTKHPYYCPHGRPIIVQMSLDELDGRFERH